ncbi:histidinol-phosphate aminotransferase family protein [Ktedonosporobacter rubrisoli]|uniref:histidinol-phosphate transaminase n=1 Tax=Ktedonosporobacter rubrisoli TaxID=2509675 RepID=A0A4P6K3S6_KTERU|nr:histidinol-phosphate transaminase [Ktedonosporobacter rubrisoli]QBD82705.1 histidinol-phosphate aminotransferase family protein [Ktedonosporobacter rubrisoli]
MEDLKDQPMPLVHGAFDYLELARLGLQPGEVVDFSVNSMPYGPSPRVYEAIAATAVDRYPDRVCWHLRQSILDHELRGSGLEISEIICGNGTSELIWTLARCYLGAGTKAAILGPTFGEYRAASLAAGATVVELRASQEQQFQLDVSAVGDWLGQEQPSLVWLCNPNNPTGTYLEQQKLIQLLEACQHNGALLVMDESYRHFLFPPEPLSALELLSTDSQVLVLRSLTKDFALAGVRLGYALGAKAALQRLSAQLPSWNVSALAQAAGVAALADREHLATSLACLESERQAFFAALLHAGLAALPSRTHFCLVEVGDACLIRQKLLQRKLLVRDCTSFGLPQYIRVSVRPEPEWQRLVAALQEVL